MTETITDTWDRDLRVLRAVVAKYQTEERPIGAHELETTVGMTRDEVRAAYKNLHRGGYVVGASNERTISWHVFDVTERALREVGAWPSPQTALDRMIAALEAIADHTSDEDTRTRARKILDGLTGAGKTIGLSVATAAITGQLPGQ